MKKTLRFRADEPSDLQRAAEILRRGGLVAFPTETVYGLGANALSAEAVAGIFAAKARPAWDPLIVHVPDLAGVSEVAVVEGILAERVQVLAEAFWPGPLTLLLPRRPVIPAAVTAGRALVGVRVPAHSAALALLRACGLPLAAPSANRFGHVSPTTAAHVLADLEGRIEAVLDGGPCAVGLESTVLDPAPTPMVVYRAGGVTAQALAEVTGVPVQMFVPATNQDEPASLPSPGVGIRHYAPEATVRLSEGQPDALWAAVQEAWVAGTRIGVLLPSDWAAPAVADLVVQRWGRWDDATELAAGLFAGLRALEEQRVGMIVCPLPEAGELRDALRDRLLKAARPRQGGSGGFAGTVADVARSVH